MDGVSLTLTGEGIRHIALTDHNRIHTDMEQLRALYTDMEIISASEISAAWLSPSGENKEIHIVGLYLEQTDALKEFLQTNCDNGIGRLENMLVALAKCGVVFNGYLEVLENFDASECLEVVTHECQHAYQARLVDAYQNANAVDRQLRLFNAARSYSEEYVNYEDGDSSFSGYYNQDCESDAREYSYEAVDYYYRIIDEYLDGKD